MSLVAPLRALRPESTYAGRVASLPYDVFSVEEARQVAAANPLTFLRVEKSEIDLPGGSGEDQRIYDRARENLGALIRQGILRRDPAPMFYLYRQQAESHSQTGIVAGASVAEYAAGRIKRHELTRAGKEADRVRHIDTVGAQTGPVFLTYRGRAAIDVLVARVASRPPEVAFQAADGVRHAVWRIDAPGEIREVSEGFAPVEALYIADGHHRAAAAAAVSRLRDARSPGRPADDAHHLMLSVLFPRDQLRIMDYNRAVRDLGGLTEQAFLARIGERFRVTPDFSQKKPGRSHEFGMVLGGRWYRLEARAEILRDDDPVAGLDVSLLQDQLLGPILGILDPRTDSRIEFIGGVRGMGELESLVGRRGFAVAFSLYPPTMDQMMAVADAGLVMPPKSTWFEPKLLSGLFVHSLE